MALDFLNSIAAPRGTWLEWIPDGPAFLLWLEEAGEITPEERKGALASFSQRQLDDLAAGARELREWFRGLLVRAKERGSRAVGQRDIDKFNTYLGAATTSPQLQRNKDRRLLLIRRNKLEEPHAFLAPVAKAMAQLLCEEDLSLVSRCGNPGCSIWFCDRTKSHRRRWCDPTICGNRSRVAAFRRRNRADA